LRQSKDPVIDTKTRAALIASLRKKKRAFYDLYITFCFANSKIVFANIIFLKPLLLIIGAPGDRRQQMFVEALTGLGHENRLILQRYTIIDDIQQNEKFIKQFCFVRFIGL
jgi:hypothetical protein